MFDEQIAQLNAPDSWDRLDALKALMQKIQDGEMEAPTQLNSVNNHIHTTYSFSPYSPTKAVWMAYQAGLQTAGIMDHDSIAGAREFIKAGEIVGMATTIGMELRAKADDTPLYGRRINNPDQESIFYMAIHGIPHTQIDKVEAFIRPYREARNLRNRAMTRKINELVAPYGLSVDFDEDVYPISENARNGSITERHITAALANKIIGKYGKGEALVTFLKTEMKLNISPKIEGYLLDEQNPHAMYDLLGVLKSEFVPKFYIQATDECPHAREAVEFARKIGAISAYAYLGDVGESVTGDKKAQRFEDQYIDELFEAIHALGFNAVTYMPSRNTMEQLGRIKQYCARYNLMEISGEDINQPRQSFICKAMENPEFANLFDSTWALIGHELAATKNLEQSLFSKESIAKDEDITKRIQTYRQMGTQEYFFWHGKKNPIM